MTCETCGQPIKFEQAEWKHMDRNIYCGRDFLYKTASPSSPMPTAASFVNGCPVLERHGDAVIIKHPLGYMAYRGARLGIYKTLAGARRSAIRATQGI